MPAESNAGGVSLPELAASLSPMMRTLLLKMTANRLALREAREAHDKVGESFAQLLQPYRQMGNPRLVEAAEALANAPNYKRREPYLAFTATLLDLASGHPRGSRQRKSLYGVVDQVSNLMRQAQKARKKELGALLRLDELSREAIAQEALERNQRGGIH